MKRYLHALLILCLLFPLGIKADENPDSVFVFGDSLSDTGNLAAFRDVNFPPLPPFPGPHPIGTVGLCNPVDIFILGNRCDDIFHEASRVSNGPVAVEVMARRLGHDALQPSLYFLPPVLRPFSGTNYAVAGAVAGGSGPGDLGAQVTGFLVDQGLMAPPDALYVIIIGGNDVIDAVKAAAELLQGDDLDEDEKPKAIIDAAIDAIEVNIERLIEGGARKILVGNVPNIGSLPATRDEAVEAGLPEALVIGAATGITVKFNRKLARRVDRIRARHADEAVKIKEFDIFRYFEIVRILARLFGLNAVDACFNTDKYQDFSMGMAEREFHPDCAPAAPGEPPRFDKFVFFDDIHPTGLVHAAIGKAMARAARRLVAD